MSLGTFVGGRFSATWLPGAVASAGNAGNGSPASDIGLTEDGWEVSVTHAKELIQQSDAHGDQAIDAFWRGFSGVFIQATMLEWKTQILWALFPYNEFKDTGGTELDPGVIGRLDSNLVGTLVWTKTIGTPAAAAPITMTATHAIIAENFDIRYALTSKLRKFPVRWRIYPYDASGTIKYVTAT